MQYRVARLLDEEGIAQLHADSWRRTYRGDFLDAFLDGDLVANRHEVWRQRLGRPGDNQFVYVATEENQIAGFVCAYGAEDPKWGSLLDNLHVSHTHRRKGIGSVLIERAGSWLVSAYPDCGVYLWVLESNEGARRFYERLGATNAGAVEMENAGGGTARSCRYVWERPEALGRRQIENSRAAPAAVGSPRDH